MKEKIIKFGSILLAASLLFCCLAGCKKKGKGDEEDESKTVSTTDSPYRDGLPQDLDYGKAEVNIVSREFDWYFGEITVASEDSSDNVSSAVFERQHNVEGRLNIQLQNHKIAGSGKEGYTVVVEALQRDQMSGDKMYDIAVNNMYHTMAKATEGMFYKMNDVPHVDLSRPYYSQNFNDKATVGDSLYAVTGDASLSFIKFAFATFFNKQMVADHHVDDLYTTVLNGDWTFEYQLSLIKDLYTDNNANSKKDEADTFGFVTNPVLGVDPYWSAFDLSIVGKSEEHVLEPQISVSKITNALEKINRIFWQEDGTLVLKHQADDGEMKDQAKMFAENRAMFTTLRLDLCEDPTLRDMKSEYGIIPMPKYDADQEQYYSYCHDLFSVFCISSSVSADRIGMVGATLECFFSESLKCRQELFEVALKVKYQSDSTVSQMLDIVVDHMKIDTGWIYSAALSDFALCLRTMVQMENSRYSSYYGMNKGLLKTNVDKLVANMSK